MADTTGWGTSLTSLSDANDIAEILVIRRVLQKSDLPATTVGTINQRRNSRGDVPLG